MKRIAAAILEKPVKRLLFFIALLLLFSAEILRVYFLMPFPGSQTSDTVSYAYWLDRWIGWIRVLVLLLSYFALVSVFKKGRIWEKIILPLLLASYAVVFFAFNFRLPADKIFYQPVNKSFTNANDTDLDRSKLVIGVVIDGQAKAYPIQLIGYHHQVIDTVGKTPVMVTYCTVCRSARVFSPMVNGKQESFRLVGMDHYNAVLEDAATKSWWQQATGVAITGPLKGQALKEFSSSQMTMDAWLRQYPSSLVMKPDTLFMDRYFKLEDYDKGTMRSDLVRRDNISWQHNSWIVGVANSSSSKAYDWNELLQKRIIQDSVDNMPILLTIENDSASFHVYDRRIDDMPLSFGISPDKALLVDDNTHSSWNMDGLCVDGQLKGKRLLPVQSYNEFWHSWQTFHKNAKVYVGSSYALIK
ncbi:MAG TPA: DUF3179 domain-containing (seleno)protein [Puia sp.]|nr:DUF3179 domain-containing (seleno)protein [Puia sp.]